ncbi:presenilin family intramembrane aspartyl protease PSH [Halobaculum sp. D14]|uniref:presenilin family intramembrane aspartyl protease PSH n=1 Tax=Halobaculum sp. D14 TaxID=3421642 RepID=UPI003EBC1501
MSRLPGALGGPRVRGVLGTAALFGAVQLLAVLVAPRLASSGLRYGDGGDALLPLVLGVAFGTALSLAVARFGVSRRAVRAVMVASVGAALWFALSAFVGDVVGAVLAAAGVGLVWFVPRPAVRNAVAVVAVAGAAGLFGASLDPAYAAAALVAVAAYDVYAVYGSGHMGAMADAASDLRLPSMFVVPTSDDYDDAAFTVDAGDRDGAPARAPTAAILGAGDALFPALLTSSAAVHGAAALGDWSVEAAPSLVPVLPAPAVGALVGSFAGFAALQVLVHRRRGLHAGLPWVNGGAVAGWLAALLL